MANENDRRRELPGRVFASSEAHRADGKAGRVRLQDEVPKDVKHARRLVFVQSVRPLLHEMYLKSADVLLATSGEQLRDVALPIVFLQRHALELALKHALISVECYKWLADGSGGPEPSVNGKAFKNHDLRKLCTRVSKRLASCDKSRWAEIMSSLVKKWVDLDRTSMWTRYYDESADLSLDLVANSAELRTAFDQLFKSPENPHDDAGKRGLIEEYMYRAYLLEIAAASDALPDEKS